MMKMKRSESCFCNENLVEKNLSFVTLNPIENMSESVFHASSSWKKEKSVEVCDSKNSDVSDLLFSPGFALELIVKGIPSSDFLGLLLSWKCSHVINSRD
jgi:hypothetical protein